jgi:hypothetical protein
MEPKLDQKDDTPSTQDAHSTLELINASGHVQELDRQ